MRVALLLVAPSGCNGPAAESLPGVTFSQSASRVAVYDFVEITTHVAGRKPANPFLDASLRGVFEGPAGKTAVAGFCDSANGSIYRIRFMPAGPGSYHYTVTYGRARGTRSASGTFETFDAGRRGPIRVDPRHPWHFIWEGTGEHYFFNGTTTFLLMAWSDESVIRQAIDRLHRLRVNRIRVLLGGGRPKSYWGEPVVPTVDFRPYLNPWVAARPDDPRRPDFDYTRFNVAYWQKYERMLAYARARDMIVSVVFDWNDTAVHPDADSEDEQRYFHYAATRLAAFSNVTWDLGDDIDSYRSLGWSRRTGTRLEAWDPYHHLATDHPSNNAQQDRIGEWFGFTSFQAWQRPIHKWMLMQRIIQERSGRIIPQTNEEYGYEDHYPVWSPNYPDGQTADANRRAAWEMAMAGTYQTTGETAKRGTGIWPDSGGGWVNGRGDSTMTMLRGYTHMVAFFTGFDWWRADPHDELVSKPAFCLAWPGHVYAVYLPHGGKVTVRLVSATYQASWVNPRNGAVTAIGSVRARLWTSPEAADTGDWALLLRGPGG